MDELSKYEYKGWTFTVGHNPGVKVQPYVMQVEAPDGGVIKKSFANDNDARVAMSEAKALILMALRAKGE